MNEEAIQDEVGHYIASLIQNNFGESPENIIVTFKQPFILIQLLGFSLPSEKSLLEQQEADRIWNNREEVMMEIKAEVVTDLRNITGFSVTEFYTDWDIEKETGLFLAVLDEEIPAGLFQWQSKIDQNALKERVIELTRETETEPAATEVYQLKEEIFLIERLGIINDTERELIKSGLISELKTAKRQVEHRLLEKLFTSLDLKQEISASFIDWDFEKEKGYVVFILNT